MRSNSRRQSLLICGALALSSRVHGFLVPSAGHSISSRHEQTVGRRAKHSTALHVEPSTATVDDKPSGNKQKVGDAPRKTKFAVNGGEGKVLDEKELAQLLGVDENSLDDSYFETQYDQQNKPSCSSCKSSDEPFHVHFGLGRLGCGLVIPSLEAAGKPFALVQRASKAWGSIAEDAEGSSEDDKQKHTLSFKVNGKDVVSALNIVTSNSALGDDGCVGDSSFVALSDDKPLLEALVKRATSFSSSLGPALTKVLPDILNVLEDSEASERPILYACENEHQPVDDLAEQVKSKVHCVKCMVDRICVSRVIKEKDHVVDTIAEKYDGRIIVLTPLDDEKVVPFGGNVLVPKEKATAQFFYKRKFSIVNGMHSVLAFMTLRENGAEAGKCDEDESYDLIKPLETEGDLKKEIDGWTKLRCVQLLDEFGVETIAKAVDVDVKDEKAVFKSLLEWGDEALERFSSIDDTTDRIFGGERSNRWCNRVRPLWVFTQENEFSGTDTPMGRFIKYADVDEKWVKDKIAALTEYSASVCEDDIKQKYASTQSCLEGKD